MRRLFVVVAVLVCALAPHAFADGGPSVHENVGLSGIVTPTGFRYVVVGNPQTGVLVRLGPEGRVVATKPLPGRFTIQGVAYDGSPTGLSADGKILVLVEPRYSFPRKRTRFLALEVPGMFVRHDVVLEGDFNLDAVSPDGSLLYFIHYLSSRDPSRYEVRAYDLPHERLLREPLVAKGEDGPEAMRGSPISRTSSQDGRWAYTLYDGGGGAPFIHALDTVEATAHCIDLDSLAGREDLTSLRLQLVGSGPLTVVTPKAPLLAVDPASFTVSSIGETPPSKAAAPWAVIAAAIIILLAGAAFALLLLRRRRLATS